MQHVSSSGAWRITHQFHRNETLLSLLDTLPDGAVDCFDSFDVEPPVIAVVEVAPEDERLNLSSATSFCTDFTDQDGKHVQKVWQPAAGKTTLRYLAVFGLPDGIIGAETSARLH